MEIQEGTVVGLTYELKVSKEEDEIESAPFSVEVREEDEEEQGCQEREVLGSHLRVEVVVDDAVGEGALVDLDGLHLADGVVDPDLDGFCSLSASAAQATL